MAAATRAADAGRLVRAALADPSVSIRFRAAAAVDVIAAGKAADAMRQAFLADCGAASVRYVMVTGPETGHPLANEASLVAARRALEIAAAAADNDLLVVLLSGGASAKLALPAPGITLADKQAATDILLRHGADIAELNTVRKHLSAIKGGQLAAATRATVMTLAVSDVVGDDLSIVASGPTVPDASTFEQALAVVLRRGGAAAYPASVVQRLERGAHGGCPETPKPGDARLPRLFTRVIGNRQSAVEGARACALSQGYQVHVIEAPVTGEARCAGPTLWAAAAAARVRTHAPLCVISAGETTVHVAGRGRGGRNQELAAAMIGLVAETPGLAAVASVGTDGIDGPTDAAGAIVDTTSAPRAAAAGLDPAAALADNDTYTLFDRLDDLIRTGPSGTNVGDLQIILTA